MRRQGQPVRGPPGHSENPLPVKTVSARGVLGPLPVDPCGKGERGELHLGFGDLEVFRHTVEHQRLAVPAVVGPGHVARRRLLPVLVEGDVVRAFARFGDDIQLVVYISFPGGRYGQPGEKEQKQQRHRQQPGGDPRSFFHIRQPFQKDGLRSLCADPVCIFSPIRTGLSMGMGDFPHDRHGGDDPRHMIFHLIE